MQIEKPTFSPARTGESIIDPETRICELQEMLLDKSIEFQHKNIRFLIHLYEVGELPPPPGKTAWVFDGKLVDGLPAEIPEGSAVWAEDFAFQFTQTSQTQQAVAIQMAQSVSYGLHATWRMHEIFAKFRLVAAFGGNPNTVLNVSIANDTGSGIQTIFTTDLANLNYNPATYRGHLGLINVATANGIVCREKIMIEMQITKADGTAVSAWFLESAVVTPFQLGPLSCRLSGNAMRNHLFFATAPGNITLYVAEKKNGIMMQLPVV